MHPNTAKIEKLFTSVDRHDLEAIADCYAEDATFQDIAFRLRGKAAIRKMWRMIVSGDIRVTLQACDANDSEGRAEVLDIYTFRETQRPVRNPIVSHFRFENGKITQQRDECDPKAWAKMAIGGILGFLSGRLRFLRALGAAKTLHDFNRKHPERSAAPGRQ